jgi:AraC-like DNA-binding protein
MDTQDIAPTDGLNHEEKETQPNPDTTIEDKSDTVPLKKYMEEKRARRDIESQVETLQEEITKLKTNTATGAINLTTVNDEIRRLAQEHNVDESFLTSLVSTVRKTTKEEIRGEMEKDFSPKISQIERERAIEKAERKFEEAYSKALAENPEFNGIVNKDVIKTLAFSQQNSKKTLSEIIDDTYGSAVQGKKSIETQHASKQPTEVDYNNPKSADWDKIESDPTAKEKWSKEAAEQIKRYM